MVHLRLKRLLKLCTQASLAALLCASPASAVAAEHGTVTFHVNVLGTCQLRGVDAEGVTLRCTQGFSPADPRTVISLWGQLPAQPLLALTDSQPAAEGGTLNRYTFAASPDVQQADQQQAGWATFY
ncbi:hypothetical protein E7T06_08990 [Deinococcus sp. Arct2-2]|uniref:hypothetical protein n=1 Tax=Deinococcus sp. Arct2-2 TaxID=2568653 RepID=UPI0010A4583F|nr:hypothetical protein [Deinococcus sp. Arct2-2]THF70032.1 hypothetical protein E7T06_08990 [Deinococcus sp. Arct2-2]